jgi:H+/Cl- antiporter ClcA
MVVAGASVCIAAWLAHRYYMHAKGSGITQIEAALKGGATEQLMKMFVFLEITGL